MLYEVITGPDSFTTGRNLETIARQTAIVGTAALGMTLVNNVETLYWVAKVCREGPECLNATEKNGRKGP